VEVARIRAAIECHGGRFLSRIFTEAELRDCNGRVASLAARFAAKEAVSKALGCGIGKVGWLEIEVISGKNRAPHLLLRGEAQRLAAELGLSAWSVSLSHTENQALAFVVAATE
jgi:holo-[acyl-carrier protein] synthase